MQLVLLFMVTRVLADGGAGLCLMLLLGFIPVCFVWCSKPRWHNVAGSAAAGGHCCGATRSEL